MTQMLDRGGTSPELLRCRPQGSPLAVLGKESFQISDGGVQPHAALDLRVKHIHKPLNQIRRRDACHALCLCAALLILESGRRCAVAHGRDFLATRMGRV
jgi:hypothetical protein